MTSAPFVPGIELSRLLHEEAVRPILAATHPGLRYAAARVGAGSEVLGFDTPRSTDHDWGPCLDLFLPAGDAARLRPAPHPPVRRTPPRHPARPARPLPRGRRPRRPRRAPRPRP